MSGILQPFFMYTNNSGVAVEYGLFGGGSIGGFVLVNTTQKYKYLSNIVSSGTVLGLAIYGLAATGNSTVGIFGGGYSDTYSNYTDKYTYSDDTRVAGTLLGLARSGLAATGNSTVGIFGGGYGGGYSNYTDKYTYSSNSRVAGTVLSTTLNSLAACSATANGL